MTDLQKEMLRQIAELSQELKALRERIAVLEANGNNRGYFVPPYKVTC